MAKLKDELRELAAKTADHIINEINMVHRKEINDDYQRYTFIIGVLFLVSSNYILQSNNINSAFDDLVLELHKFISDKDVIDGVNRIRRECDE